MYYVNMKLISIFFFYLDFKLHCVFWVIMDNVLENHQYILHFSYCVLTDQQSQVQATNKVYHT